MKREFSAGGIVFKRDAQALSFLLIKNAAMRDPSKSYWGFPKGHLEPGESGKQAATREVREETGIRAQITDKVGDSKYTFTVNNERIFKIVTIFLMEYQSGELTHQTEELLDAGWFNKEQVLKQLSFSNDKALFKKALEILNR